MRLNRLLGRSDTSGVTANNEVHMQSTGHYYRTFLVVVPLLAGIALVVSCMTRPKGVQTDPAVRTQKFPKEKFDDKINANADELLAEGRKIFRYDTFGSEGFWGDKLQLHKAILREQKGGIGAGLTAR